MKKTITLLSFALLGTVAFFSCKKSDNNSPAYSMSATVGSTNFSATNVYATDSAGELEIYGANSGGFPLVDIYIDNYTGPGVYNVTDSNDNYVIYETSLNNALSVGNGTITISSLSSGTVKGTFSGTSDDSTATKITNGAFTAKLQ